MKNKINEFYSYKNKKALTSAESIQNEIKENIKYNLYDDGLVLL